MLENIAAKVVGVGGCPTCLEGVHRLLFGRIHVGVGSLTVIHGQPPLADTGGHVEPAQDVFVVEGQVHGALFEDTYGEVCRLDIPALALCEGLPECIAYTGEVRAPVKIVHYHVNVAQVNCLCVPVVHGKVKCIFCPRK